MRTALCLTTALALTGCAAFDEPIPQPPYTDRHAQALIVPAGSRVCLSNSAAKCEALDRIADSLETPEMTARLCAAGADLKACRK
jgi:hypothetical protein